MAHLKPKVWPLQATMLVFLLLVSCMYHHLHFQRQFEVQSRRRTTMIVEEHHVVNMSSPTTKAEPLEMDTKHCHWTPMGFDWLLPDRPVMCLRAKDEDIMSLHIHTHGR